MKRLTLAIAILLLAAGNVVAQSLPPVSRSKLVAQHAVNQTNAHTNAMTNTQDTVPAQLIAPAQVRSAPDAAPVESASKREVESSAGSAAVSPAAGGFEREVFYYERSGRRDPFASLMTSGELRPLLSDLKLVAVAFDASGRNSVAVMRDLNTKEQYRVRVGHTLGRMRVSAINPRFVTFTIEEFGFSRQENLGLGDSNKGSSK